jgi:hypothetical protein
MTEEKSMDERISILEAEILKKKRA